jgi:ribosomal protein S18 acetylase RimI-like enzyme
MLGEAFAWRTGNTAAARERLSEPHLARYVEGWGRPGDLGVIATDDGVPIGAAWCRLFTEGDHGYGFVDERTPEITVAVRNSARGRGIGTALMDALVREARARGHVRLSLSVEEDNLHALSLYAHLGFRRVGQNENAWTMLLEIT